MRKLIICSLVFGGVLCGSLAAGAGNALGMAFLAGVLLACAAAFVLTPDR